MTDIMHIMVIRLCMPLSQSGLLSLWYTVAKNEYNYRLSVNRKKHVFLILFTFEMLIILQLIFCSIAIYSSVYVLFEE